MAYTLTMDEEKNQFSFICPVFNAQTKMSTCIKLRQKKWRGETVDKRQGCQVAMDCGKCPAAAVVEQISYNRYSEGVPDNYGSLEPVVGKLRADILGRVHRSLITDKVLNKYAVTDAERDLLLTATKRIEEQMKTAPGGSGKFVPHANSYATDARNSVNSRRRTSVADETVERTEKVARVQKPSNNNVLADAAKTGDMAAALNAAS